MSSFHSALLQHLPFFLHMSFTQYKPHITTFSFGRPKKCFRNGDEGVGMLSIFLRFYWCLEVVVLLVFNASKCWTSLVFCKSISIVFLVSFPNLEWLLCLIVILFYFWTYCYFLRKYPWQTHLWERRRKFWLKGQ